MEVQCESMERKTEQKGITQLSPEYERDLVSGVRYEVDENDEEKQKAISQLESDLTGAKENTERKEIWVRTIVPGSVSPEVQHNVLPTPQFGISLSQLHMELKRPEEERKTREELPMLESDEVAIEFLLPSGDIFWERYKHPDKHWEEHNKFVKLLNATGTPPSDITQLVGSRLPATYDRGWEPDLDHIPNTSKEFSRDKKVKAYEKVFERMEGNIAGLWVVIFTFVLLGILQIFLLSIPV